VAEVKWIKMSVDMFDDEKIKIIQAMPDGDALLVVWIKLIALAGKTNAGGYIYISENIPYTDDMLAVVMNKPISTIRLAMQTFIGLGMLENDTKGIYLVNFDKHQNLDKLAEIREYNRLAQQKSRTKRKALNNVNDMSMTSQECQGTDKEEEKEKERDLEEEGEEKSASPASKLEKVGGTLGQGVLMLTEEQKDDLLDKLSLDEYNLYCKKLSDYIIAHPNKTFKSHYQTILKWVVEDRARV
jgi:predicted phage replisome organizer